KIMGREDLYPKRKLISESSWLRTYKIGPNDLLYESKFLFDNLEIDAESFIATWTRLSPRERWEFGTAYQGKPQITADDEKILTFLMTESGRSLWQDIPILLTRHSDRQRVVQFLEARIKEDEPKANYLQALQLMQAREALPLLQEQMKALESRVQNPAKSSRV